jgi:hypothetical protein
LKRPRLECRDCTPYLRPDIGIASQHGRIHMPHDIKQAWSAQWSFVSSALLGRRRRRSSTYISYKCVEACRFRRSCRLGHHHQNNRSRGFDRDSRHRAMLCPRCAISRFRTSFRGASNAPLLANSSEARATTPHSREHTLPFDGRAGIQAEDRWPIVGRGSRTESAASNYAASEHSFQEAQAQQLTASSKTYG